MTAYSTNYKFRVNSNNHNSTVISTNYKYRVHSTIQRYWVNSTNHKSGIYNQGFKMAWAYNWLTVITLEVKVETKAHFHHCWIIQKVIKRDCIKIALGKIYNFHINHQRNCKEHEVLQTCNSAYNVRETVSSSYAIS